MGPATSENCATSLTLQDSAFTLNFMIDERGMLVGLKAMLNVTLDFMNMRDTTLPVK